MFVGENVNISMGGLSLESRCWRDAITAANEKKKKRKKNKTKTRELKDKDQ